MTTEDRYEQAQTLVEGIESDIDRALSKFAQIRDDLGLGGTMNTLGELSLTEMQLADCKRRCVAWRNR